MSRDGALAREEKDMSNREKAIMRANELAARDKEPYIVAEAKESGAGRIVPLAKWGTYPWYNVNDYEVVALVGC